MKKKEFYLLDEFEFFLKRLFGAYNFHQIAGIRTQKE